MSSTKQTRKPYDHGGFLLAVEQTVTMGRRATAERRRLAYLGTLDGILTGKSSKGKQAEGTMTRKDFGARFGLKSEGQVRHDIRMGRVLVERGEDSPEYAAITKDHAAQRDVFAWLADPKERFTVARFKKDLAKPIPKPKPRKPRAGKVTKVTPAGTVKTLSTTVAALAKQADNLTAKQWETVEAARDALNNLSAEYAAKVAESA